MIYKKNKKLFVMLYKKSYYLKMEKTKVYLHLFYLGDTSSNHNHLIVKYTKNKNLGNNVYQSNLKVH